MTAGQKARNAYSALLTGYFGLLALLLFWNLGVNPPQKISTIVIIFAAIAALALPLRGVLSGSFRSCAGIAYLSLLYLFHGLTELASEPFNLGSWFDALEVFFAALLLLGTVLYIRFTAKARADG